MKPMVGITTYFVKSYEMGVDRARGQLDQDMLMSTTDYSIAVERAGGVPVTLPCIEDEEIIEHMVKRLDALILAGGPDIDPLIYCDYVAKGVNQAVPERDHFEFKLLNLAIKHKKAVLGICRGFQLMNVYFGGTLDQHDFVDKISGISHSGRKLPRYEPRHNLTIKKDSMLYKLFRRSDILVNSYHHQTIDKLGDGLVATAWANDNCIEGYEHSNIDNIFAVQWHPEMMIERYIEQLVIFEKLIKLTKTSKELC